MTNIIPNAASAPKARKWHSLTRGRHRCLLEVRMRRCVWQHWNYAGGICVVALLGAIFLWSRSKPAKHLNVISQNVTIASARGGTPRANAYYASPLSPTHLRPEEYRMSTKPRDANSPCGSSAARVNLFRHLHAREALNGIGQRGPTG